jgi:hypothetical protein
MEDINKKKLSGETTANQLADKLTSGIFKQLSNHELDIFKQQLANRLNLVQDGPPSNINESIFSPNYFTNLRPQGSWNEPIEIMVYRNEDGGYDVSLNVYGFTGFGMSRTRNLALGDRSVPLNDFTPEYVLNKIQTVYNLKDSDKQKLTDFINNIPSQLRALEVKKGESPIRERLKDMIRKELMGDNEDEAALRDRYLRKLTVYKNIKKNRGGEFEIDQARKELIDAAKAYGIDLPTK